MHALSAEFGALRRIIPADPWAITVPELEAVARAVNSAGDEAWVREGRRGGIILQVTAGRISHLARGSWAYMISEELALLTETSHLLRETGGQESVLQALAYFHVRFESIHPLRDGNGRVGRLLLASQAVEQYLIDGGELLREIEADKRSYKAAFRAPSGKLRFALLVDQLSRLLGIVPSESVFDLPMSVEPAYLDDRPIPDDMAVGTAVGAHTAVRLSEICRDPMLEVVGPVR